MYNTKSFKGLEVSDNSEKENTFTINTGDKGDYFKTLILGFPQGQVKYQEKDFEFKDGFKANLSDIYSLITGNVDDKLLSFTKWINKVYSENGQNINHHQITNIFTIISKVVSSKKDAISLKSIKLDDSGDPVLIITTPENPHGIPMELLSQGLTNVFTWICHFVQRIYEHYGEFADISKVHAILIIDEIDKYLHPKWQKNILRVLLDFFKNTQFIITTHSPLVLMGLEKKQIARIKLDENDKPCVEYNDDFNVWGWRFQEVMERFMLDFDPYEYNLVEEENKLELLKNQGADETEIADLEEKIMRITESYEAKGRLGKLKKTYLKREEELLAKNKVFKEMIKKLRAENEQLKS